MLDYIIDANIIISILISGKASYKPILNYYNFFTPDFALEEIEKYKAVIFEKSKLNISGLQQFAFLTFNNISVIPQIAISDEAYEKGYELTYNIDIKDLTYVALAIEHDSILLTRDKKLYTGLKHKGFRKTMIFENFLNSI